MNPKDTTAILYITDQGRLLSERLKNLYPDASISKFKIETIAALWNNNKCLIFIMASGIVVRSIAPLIKSKLSDPAVVVLDDKGEFAVSLLSGHLGGANSRTSEIAAFLGGQAVITTSSDVNNLPALDLWAAKNDLFIEDLSLLPQIGTSLINTGSLRIYSEIDMDMPDEFLITDDPELADVLITNRTDLVNSSSGRLFLRPKNLVLGIGCNSGTPKEEIDESVRLVLEENSLAFGSICSVATIDIKANEPGLVDFANQYGFSIETFSPDDLNSAGGDAKSETVFKATGAYAVAEPAALLGSRRGSLLVPKNKRGNLTVAVAVKDRPCAPAIDEGEKKQKGSIYIIGTGPGSVEHITPYAQDAIRRSDAIVGYRTYLDLIPELTAGKKIYSTGMTRETARCQKAVDLALSGKSVAVISGGDPGIYAMAGLVLEILKADLADFAGADKSILRPHIEVIPGISALNACAARLGAPLMHDFASISLSDRLTAWDLIEKRLAAAASADFVIALYNPKSKGRQEHIKKARAIMLKHRSTETPVGIVRAAMRADERVVITNLRDMLNHEIDMQTTLIIGNSQTFVWDNMMITPRGYGAKSI